jgi:hypothetical protein
MWSGSTRAGSPSTAACFHAPIPSSKTRSAGHSRSIRLGRIACRMGRSGWRRPTTHFHSIAVITALYLRPRSAFTSAPSGQNRMALMHLATPTLHRKKCTRSQLLRPFTDFQKHGTRRAVLRGQCRYSIKATAAQSRSRSRVGPPSRRAREAEAVSVKAWCEENRRRYRTSNNRKYARHSPGTLSKGLKELQRLSRWRIAFGYQRKSETSHSAASLEQCEIRLDDQF